MTEFPAEYSLVFVMPDICRTFYLALDPAEQKQVDEEIADVIKGSIDREVYKTWANRRITTDEDGFKPEDEVRRELDGLVRKLRKDGKRLGIRDERDLDLWGSKGIQCGHDHLFAYSLRCDDRPWIIPSTLFPQLVFDVRASVHWMGPAAYPAELVPKERKKEPAKARPSGSKKPAKG